MVNLAGIFDKLHQVPVGAGAIITFALLVITWWVIILFIHIAAWLYRRFRRQTRNFNLNILDVFGVSTPTGEAGFERDWHLISGDFEVASSNYASELDA